MLLEPMMSPESRRDSSTWLGILEAMECEVRHNSERALRVRMGGGKHEANAEQTASFEPPSDAGPIPIELVDRAQNLLAAQHEAIERVEHARRTTGRHLAAMRAVPPHRDGRSVYLDISG